MRFMHIGYARLSKDHLHASMGIERQKDAIVALAERAGHTITRWIIDEDASASASAKRKRPGFEELMTAMEQDQVSAIYVAHQDRLVRNPRDLERILACPDDIPVYAGEGSLNLSTPEGRAMARIACAFADVEVENTRRRVRALHHQKRELGAWQGGHVPKGYEVIDGDLVLNQAEAKVIRKACREILQGKETLAGAGRRIGIGATGLKRALVGPMWAAVREHNGEEYPCNWEPMFSGDERRQFQEHFANTATGTRTRVKLLTGMITCGKCGGGTRHTNRFLKTRGEKVSIYECRTQGCYGASIHAEELERQAFEEFVELVGNSDGSAVMAWTVGTLEQRRELLSQVGWTGVIPVRDSGVRGCRSAD